MEELRHLARAYCLLLLSLALIARGDVVSSSRVHRQTGDDGDDLGAVSSNGDKVQRYGVHPQVKDPEDEFSDDVRGGAEAGASNVSSVLAPAANTSGFPANKINQTSSKAGEQPQGNTTVPSKQLMDVEDNEFPTQTETDIEGSHYVDYDTTHDLMLGFGDSSDDDEGVVRRREKPKSKRKQKHGRKENDRNLMLHEAVRNLLGFSDQRDHQKDHVLHDTTKDKQLPEYVKDLYQRFQSGEMNAGLVHGNTIRSIHTRLGTVEGEPMFLFNLSSLKPTEKLVNAEIHVYRRRLKPWLRRLELEIVLHQVAPHYISQVGKITLRESASGWQWYDVTSAVRSCLASGKQPSHLFSLSFRKQRPNGISKPVLLRKFGKHHSMPFLVIYSNETEAVNFSQLDLLAERLVQRKEDDATEDSSNNELEDSLLDINHLNQLATNDVLSDHHYIKSIDLNQPISTSKKSESPKQQASRVQRKKRSILTNEIPEDPDDMDTIKQRNKIPKTHPGILQSRQDYRQQTNRAGIIPMPEHYLLEKKRKARLRKKQKQKLEQRRQRFPKEWEDVQLPQSELKKTCDRKMLRVDFADIGWADWIISPKSFEAHYCAGECPFPLTKKLRPSNHATIQSIVHAIGLYDKVPAPCCVPDVMSSITLLYFDEDRNVVLKNYPGMTVESCACR